MNALKKIPVGVAATACGTYVASMVAVAHQMGASACAQWVFKCKNNISIITKK